MPVERKERGDERLAEKKNRIFDNTMLIHMAGSGKEPHGEIIHCDLQKPVPYKGLAELIFRMEEIASFLQISGEAQAFRSISGELEVQTLPEEYCRTISMRGRTRSGFCQERYLKRIKDIIRVELIGRKYVSFQGRLQSRETEGEYIYFRSALELMYLLSEQWYLKIQKSTFYQECFIIDEK
ncbi:MAG: hypothetical protein HFG56_03805 [Lachnospiraceae bacterium]|nr:hypothetical protein [Lachnospiraceae bacterium]